jgi:hypothetical protein
LRKEIKQLRGSGDKAVDKEKKAKNQSAHALAIQKLEVANKLLIEEKKQLEEENKKKIITV